MQRVPVPDIRCHEHIASDYPPSHEFIYGRPGGESEEEHFSG